MTSTAALASTAIGDLKDWLFPVEGMTCASGVFGEPWRRWVY
jgi:hypothetical protein